MMSKSKSLPQKSLIDSRGNYRQHKHANDTAVYYNTKQQCQ